MGESYLVIGGGISGLSAAWALSQADPTARITVLEGSSALGGKIGSAQVAGLLVDTGAESLLVRRPEALQLIDELGLGEGVVQPATTRAAIWSRGALHPMPQRTVMGIPSDPRSLSPLLRPEEIARVREEPMAPAPSSSDVSVGDFVSGRLGDAVVDRLIEPLLGGVYAGHAREISLAAALPAMVPAQRTGMSLVAAAGAQVAPAPPPGVAAAPVFATLTGGVHRLIAELERQLLRSRVQIHTGVLAREVRRRQTRVGAGGFEVVTGPRPAPISWHADRLIVATPPAAASRLLHDLTPEAATELGRVESASMAIVTLALPAERAPSLEGSGLLVPPVEGVKVKAATFSGNKWEWIRTAARSRREPVVMLRASLGRHRQAADLQREDSDLVSAVRRDLETMLGQPVPAPVDAHVQRWGAALPQYAVGHLDRVAAIRSSVATVPGLAVCGATYQGVGIPACIASGRSAATQVLHAQWVA